jgi:branched-chain amino acid transport system permease protein
VLERLRRNPAPAALIALGAILLALLPRFVSSYVVLLFISVYANVALATAWAFFSGTARYISLATAAFFGVGIYTLAIGYTYLPVPVAVLAAGVIGFLVALIVGLSTLRLRGVYFVVFTFGLTELVHQVINWSEIRNGTVTRFIFTNVPHTSIYATLLAVALVTVIGSWYVGQTRLGFALRAIGEDETVARHTGINTTLVKVLCFAASASVMALVGAVFQLQHNYVDASTAFNNTWSFQVLIAALLGGPSRAWGPALGAIVLVLLSEYFSGAFAGSFPIALGLCFVVIVYFLPGGIAPLIERYYHSFDASRMLHTLRTGRFPDRSALADGLRARIARFNALRRL